MQIMRIHEFKRGPFHEHSSQLHSIAVGVPNWGKVNSGLIKMYQVGERGFPIVVIVTHHNQGRSTWETCGRTAYPLGWPYGVETSVNRARTPMIPTSKRSHQPCRSNPGSRGAKQGSMNSLYPDYPEEYDDL